MVDSSPWLGTCGRWWKLQEVGLVRGISALRCVHQANSGTPDLTPLLHGGYGVFFLTQASSVMCSASTLVQRQEGSAGYGGKPVIPPCGRIRERGHK